MELEIRQKHALALIRGERVLDIGCAEGKLLKNLAWVNPEHTQFYNRRTIEDVLVQAGYSVVAENPIGKIPRTGVHFRAPTPALACNIVVAAELKS
jgi:hypothetical protein